MCQAIRQSRTKKKVKITLLWKVKRLLDRKAVLLFAVVQAKSLYVMGSIYIFKLFTLKSVFSINVSNIKNIIELEFLKFLGPWAAGCESLMLPLCYAGSVPPTPVLQSL